MSPQPAAAPDDDAPGSLQPLAAEGPAHPGYLLLQVLSLQGWQITVRSTFAAGGVIVTAERGDIFCFQQGNSVAEIACEVVKEATRRQREASRLAA